MINTKNIKWKQMSDVQKYLLNLLFLDKHVETIMRCWYTICDYLVRKYLSWLKKNIYDNSIWKLNPVVVIVPTEKR